ncbi:flagellar hook-associated protein 3 FlgL [Acetitomaculum ruminis DSM 5522]|uniref:Flagellar hook-associated protein 3 FlgL n=1 Tax=Acetitomaculum ruminis DSM 5522 TaxID=1120918 RepID=A0A1I0WJ33_9FIRM|nr:flagellar hook-associated protein FlgL [Acetitomaculum ruminis]SFA88762.1 flagellar hook-associated protein 3 FlgL [Acetitomaculum ruminis DSM 5522]
MRVTNTMIQNNSKTMIGNNKFNVDKYNTQLQTQKKIQTPSEDPVVAIRALRLRSTVSRIEQFYDKNIPDATSWMEVTETALINMEKIIERLYTQCVSGSNDPLTDDERNAILKELQGFQYQIYDELNADDGGRTLFTGYKTDTKFTFDDNDGKYTNYEIKETFTGEDISHEYYITNNQQVTYGTIKDSVENPEMLTVERIRLAYTDLECNLDSSGSTTDYVDRDGQTVSIENYESMTLNYVDESGNSQVLDVETMSINTFEKNNVNSDLIYQPPAGKAYFIPETGEIVLASDVATTLKSATSIEFTYSKTGFNDGEVRPEMYFDCTKTEYDINGTQVGDPVEYTKVENDINYSVGFNQKMTINVEGSNVFAADMEKDIDELINALTYSYAAEKKVNDIKKMLEDNDYASEEDQQKLNEMLSAAKREQDYADERMHKMFSEGVTKYQEYLKDVNIAVTDIGSRSKRLDTTKSRVLSQKEVYKELQTKNEDREISDIIIDYTASYTAYQASLQATSKALNTSLLDYI